MPNALNLQARVGQVAEALQRAMNAPGEDLAPAALTIAGIEYPSLDHSAYLRKLDRLGEEASSRIAGGSDGLPQEAVRGLNEYLYDEQGFRGNRRHYEDPRNSYLNEVLDRRTGIPISLAVVYMEVARRAGLRVEGVNFPGHFLLRVPARGPHGDRDFLIVDPFHGGALLGEADCRHLLRQHLGDEAAFDPGLLAPATRTQIMVRVLMNLKRLYVRMESFPQARFVSDLLIVLEPAALSELRDRGLLAYRLQDFAAALRDLEAYLRLLPPTLRQAPEGLDAPDEVRGDDATAEEGDEHAQIWEHVKTLRKRVASFN